MRWLLLAFLIVPALEIGVFLWTGGMIGPWWVVGLILLTGVVGVALARQQGMETWQRARNSMNYGQVPTEEILDGICIFVGGVFLFTPGFITDIAGFILVIPSTRGLFKGMLQRFIKRLIDKDMVIYRKW
ncbi:membrane protein FxsA [Ornithinibacillus sp. L9]|uniref:Membrane protein FxsA n=1 Tax=Ornithinibacillus caprae TaxID=2678566 RepID=A0A6N8FF69_9BACI|nr:FxsA family protein [Ornithinibacillus caprae]MUK86874.1 membrane protein FxsA [Ornithinibacillus caprae]